MYGKLAGAGDVTLLPYFMERMGTKSDLMQTDGLHPNENATILMLGPVWNELQAILGPPPLEPQAGGP